MWEYINFLSLILAFLGLAITYLVSLQPKKRETKLGQKVWKQSKNLRTFGFIFETIGLFNIILWNWIPIHAWNWQIFANENLALILALILGIPCLIIMSIGVMQAGKESWEPHRQDILDQGLYKYIRHPQAITEFPLFIFLAMGVNSWLLVGILTIYNIIYLPIMRHVEEADLILRFGDQYREYQSRTGAFLPKFRHS